jgi:hypothetical protein
MATFTALAEARPRGGIMIRLPFDPDAEWGPKAEHHITGTVGGCRVRGSVRSQPVGAVLELGPAWARDWPSTAGVEVECVLEPEGPQSSTMGDDVAAAFAASPAARKHFDALPTFYRNNFARSIGSAKRPETRAKRIAQMIAALEAGRREV